MLNYSVFTNTRVIIKSLLASKLLFEWWTTYHSRSLMVQQRELPWQNCVPHSLFQTIPLLVAVSLQILFCFYSVWSSSILLPPDWQLLLLSLKLWGKLWLVCSSSSPPSKWWGYMADPCFLCYLFVWRNRRWAWVCLQRHSIKQRHFILASV